MDSRANQHPTYHFGLAMPLSAASTTYNSYSSRSSLSSSMSTSDMHSASSNESSPSFSSAPLPSPSQHQPSQYFSTMPAQMDKQGRQSSQQQQQCRQLPVMQPQQYQGRYQGEKGDGGGMPATAPFLKDFTLLAEAAKRAQMAVMMRDFGEVEL